MQNFDNDDELEGDGGFIAATNPTKEDYEAVVSQNRKLYARIKKEKERRAKEGDPAKPDPKPAEQQTPPAAKPDDDKWREKMELKTDGYSEEEIAFIQQNGGRAAIDNPFVKTAIESIRSQKKAESAQVSGDTPKSDLERQYTDQQLRDMKTEDLEKLLPKA